MKKIFYNSALLVITLILLLALTLSWFANAKYTGVSPVDLYVPITFFETYIAIDQDDNGLPDTEAGEIIYEPAESERFFFNYIYPGYTVAFKVIIGSDRTQSFAGVLRGITLPENQNLSSGGNSLDIADVMYVKYIVPGTDETNPVEVDVPISSLFKAGTRDAELFSGLILEDGEEITFKFLIYMDRGAELEYQDKLMEILACFFVENN